MDSSPAAHGPKTLFDKVWDAHVVESKEGFPEVFFIDSHLVHEVTSPQAFGGLRQRGLPVFDTGRTVATMDHNVPTKDQHLPIQEALSRYQVETLERNCAEFGVPLYPLGDENQGIVHVIGPELGLTQPGKTMVCGDSHTSTHGAFGAIAFGIGTSEVEQVLASQCLLQYKPQRMRITLEGRLGPGVTAKDLVLYLISRLSTSGCTGYFVEYAGEAIRQLSMEARMTVCNMSIEMGARGGMIAPDETTFQYLQGRPFAPKGEDWERALRYWRSLPTDEGATFDREERFDVSELEPMITYGTNPAMGTGISGRIPKVEDFPAGTEQQNFRKSLDYMGFQEGEALKGKPVDYVFIGSCTNSRMEDLRQVAEVVEGQQKAPNVTVWVVPGSQKVAEQARKEGLDKLFEAAGFEFRGAGCSACLGMNEDQIPEGKYCVSTSNRNFEGRQGQGARTLLASPLTAAATALSGRISDVRELYQEPVTP